MDRQEMDTQVIDRQMIDKYRSTEKNDTNLEGVQNGKHIEMFFKLNIPKTIFYPVHAYIEY